MIRTYSAPGGAPGRLARLAGLVEHCQHRESQVVAASRRRRSSSARTSATTTSWRPTRSSKRTGRSSTRIGSDVARRHRPDRRGPHAVDGDHHGAREPPGGSIATRTSRDASRSPTDLTDDQARALAAEGKAVVWIDGGLHADRSARRAAADRDRSTSSSAATTPRRCASCATSSCSLVHANPDGHELVAELVHARDAIRAPDARRACRARIRSTSATTTTATSTCPRRPRRST